MLAWLLRTVTTWDDDSTRLHLMGGRFTAYLPGQLRGGLWCALSVWRRSRRSDGLSFMSWKMVKNEYKEFMRAKLLTFCKIWGINIYKPSGQEGTRKPIGQKEQKKPNLVKCMHLDGVLASVCSSVELKALNIWLLHLYHESWGVRRRQKLNVVIADIHLKPKTQREVIGVNGNRVLEWKYTGFDLVNWIKVIL